MLCQRFNSVDYISFNRMLIQMHLVKMLPLFALESARLYHGNVEHACFNDYQIVRCIFFAIPCFALRFNWFFLFYVVGKTRALCAHTILVTAFNY